MSTSTTLLDNNNAEPVSPDTAATTVIGKTLATQHKGRYVNKWMTMTTSDIFIAVLKWRRAKIEPLTDDEKKHVHPVIPVDLDRLRAPLASPNSLRCTWIGHASFFVQFAGVSFLTDPVFADRCSPFSFAGPKRYRDIPCQLTQLPQVDFVTISHNHYDHLDVDVVKALGNNTHWFVPKGLKSWFASCGVNTVTELEWWEEANFGDRVRITCTPCHHNSNRGLTDRNCTLWSSWVVTDTQTNKNVFHSGDTAYCDVFKEIGHHMGGIDFGMIPIGAYSPRHIMREMHVDPAEAVQIHRDIGSKRSVGMHWGTFILTDEPLLEPPRKLKEAATAAGLKDNEFTAMKIGEIIDMDL
ncbi:hypothetical protein SAMD00019534_011350 [Acytostelium subglobosum LB1]|uniref:hypothetical protein n=1 Tax=Acytostelium subglobosum LB1 TaxID=1410327 RepID=UPI000644F9D5|nr:hypothetical protein SAMD00019534_011350 [Acytostelium subglobosum LB1]GAM17960.1 hypothetical protein SAMD00019534_011350 [Acytostelium subglobosum LB1]|eukprot:XP_012758556.1 hypothetical protein SAMD00019534_011350 [Acytostelium subglobosum LB1]